MKSRPDGCEGSPPSRSCPGDPSFEYHSLCSICGAWTHHTKLTEGECHRCYVLPLPDALVDPGTGGDHAEKTGRIAKALEYAIRLEAEHAELVATLRDCVNYLVGDQEAHVRDLLDRIDNPAP